MKTTKTQFRNFVRHHILYEVVGTGDYHTSDMTRVVNDFHRWYGKQERKMYPSKRHAFKVWLMCLPTDVNILFSDYDIHLKLKHWFIDCDENYKETSSDKELDLYLHLFTREFLELCKMYGIEF